MPNKIIGDAFVVELATLETITVPPVNDPLGYGVDLSGTTDFAFDYAEVDPQSVRAIGEALVRRYVTARGTLLDDPDYGLDLRAYLHVGMTPAQQQEVALAMRSEARKDDRVQDVTDVTLDYTPQTKTINVRMTVLSADVEFTFTFYVTSAEALIESIGAHG